MAVFRWASRTSDSIFPMAEQLDLSGETRALRRSPVTRGLEGLCALMVAAMVVLLAGLIGFFRYKRWL